MHQLSNPLYNSENASNAYKKAKMGYSELANFFISQEKERKSPIVYKSDYSQDSDDEKYKSEVFPESDSVNKNPSVILLRRNLKTQLQNIRNGKPYVPQLIPKNKEAEFFRQSIISAYQNHLGRSQWLPIYNISSVIEIQKKINLKYKEKKKALLIQTIAPK